MRPLLYVLSFLAVLGLGFWAYRENYTTQDSLRNVAALQDEIGSLHEALALQRAEWAYLNRPDRLRDLALLNFDRLGLMSMQPHQFGRTTEVAYPPPPSLADGVTMGLGELGVTGLGVTGTVDISGVLNADPEGGTTP